jgi:hypothetical protein
MSLSDLGDRAFQLIHKSTFQNKQTNKQKREREERERKKRDTHVCQESYRLAVAVASKSPNIIKTLHNKCIRSY